MFCDRFAQGCPGKECCIIIMCNIQSCKKYKGKCNVLCPSALERCTKHMYNLQRCQVYIGIWERWSPERKPYILNLSHLWGCGLKWQIQASMTIKWWVSKTTQRFFLHQTIRDDPRTGTHNFKMILKTFPGHFNHSSFYGHKNYSFKSFNSGMFRSQPHKDSK